MADLQNNFRSFIYGESFNDAANSVEVGPADVAIIGLAEITKNVKKIKHQQNISRPRPRFAQSGWANYYTQKYWALDQTQVVLS